VKTASSPSKFAANHIHQSINFLEEISYIFGVVVNTVYLSIRSAGFDPRMHSTEYAWKTYLAFCLLLREYEYQKVQNKHVF